MKVVIPVDGVVRGLDACVYLQDGLVIHVGLAVALQGLEGHGPAQERLEGEGLQLQGSGWSECSPLHRSPALKCLKTFPWEVP